MTFYSPSDTAVGEWSQTSLYMEGLSSDYCCPPSAPRLMIPLYCWKACVLLVLLALCPIDSDAVNLTQCLADAISCANNSSSQDCISGMNISNTTAFLILRTSRGSLIATTPGSADAATALSYAGCVEYCGGGQEPFNWTVFSQEYSAWLLPYLALLSQLPFGARRRTDNLMSAILTLGSPTLAGYSIYMTLLNARWVNDQLFSGIDYPSAAVRQAVVRVLISLQQVPLRVHPGESARFESLVVHPDNDDWWTTLAAELDYSHTWSIASATSITWVVIAYLLTVADSLSAVADHMNSNGQGTGSVWLWLLPIVVGWLVLSPKCDYTRVCDAYDKANRQVVVADSHDASAAPTQVTSNFGLTIRPSPDWKIDDKNITSPDEARIPPVFNYARVLSWSQTVNLIALHYRAAWQKSYDRVGVDGEHILSNVRNDVPRASRLGNRDQIIRYCRLDGHEYSGPNVLWPRGIFFNMIVASLMSLQLQWGTTGSAILVVWFTPTIGFGCRSLAYLLYGVLSTAVWILLVSSSVLGYYAHHLMDDLRPIDLESDGQCTPSTPSKLSKCTPASSIKGGGSRISEAVAIPLREIQAPHVGREGKDNNNESDEPARISSIRYPRAGWICARTMARCADWLRWIGKSLAIINAIGIVANSVFQYASVYDNCYCDSSVYTWGASAFDVITPNGSDISLASSAWIGALALALTCCGFFVGTIYLIRDSLPS